MPSFLGMVGVISNIAIASRCHAFPTGPTHKLHYYDREGAIGCGISTGTG